MRKSWVFAALLFSYVGDSFIVYTRGTESSVTLNDDAKRGRALFQKYNCASCHQVYGLGGYLGPELTTAWSDPSRGEHYIRAFLQTGGRRMPNFSFNVEEVNALLEYLKHIDSTAVKIKTGNE